MDRKLTKEEMEYFIRKCSENKKAFSSGTCAFIANDLDSWYSFMHNFIKNIGKENIIFVSRDSFKTCSNEYWIGYTTQNAREYRCRRFYKVIITKDIPYLTFMRYVWPYCVYCKELKFI